ncbi:MAG: hypothetical protein EP330_26290 [Deltaproteobacteria bacterium]|nr:MAG: hypothetical protein EP330_26290 [Deltaproteobacteria bacterium]
MFDTEATTRELVRVLRGDRSQEALRRRLRYGSNVAYHWEAGRRYPTVAGLFWLAHRTGVELGEKLPTFGLALSEAALEPWTVEGAAALMQDLQANHAHAELAEYLGVSRHSVGRWLRGESEPRFPQFLAMVEFWTARSTDFLALLCDPAELPSVAPLWERRERARSRVRDQPWSPAVELAIELERYRALGTHETGWIARQLGIEVETEVACLELLVDAGDIVLRDGLYEPVRVPRVNLQGSEDRLRVRRFWSQVAVDRAEDTPNCRGGWNLFTVSEEEYGAIKRLQRDYYRAVRNLVAESTSDEVLVLATMQVQILDRSADSE